MSVFNTCRPEQNIKGEWCVSSDYWSFPVADKRTAERLCQVIKAAYTAGSEDLRGRLTELLFPVMESPQAEKGKG